MIFSLKLADFQSLVKKIDSIVEGNKIPLLFFETNSQIIMFKPFENVVFKGVLKKNNVEDLKGFKLEFLQSTNSIELKELPQPQKVGLVVKQT